jgi:hypothetical protein
VILSNHLAFCKFQANFSDNGAEKSPNWVKNVNFRENQQAFHDIYENLKKWCKGLRNSMKFHRSFSYQLV